jgi:competence protein ComEA
LQFSCPDVTTWQDSAIIAFMSDPSRPPHWLLRRADQAAVAALMAAALVAMAGWWIAHGGWRGQLIEIERAEPLTARFDVDINAADLPELMQLPGIGEALARRIVESRKTSGPFAHHEDLLRIPGIGPKIFEQLRPYLRPIPDRKAASK